MPAATLSPTTTVVSALPRQIGTDGGYQIFEVTAQQYQLIDQHVHEVIVRQLLTASSAIPEPDAGADTSAMPSSLPRPSAHLGRRPRAAALDGGHHGHPCPGGVDLERL